MSALLFLRSAMLPSLASRLTAAQQPLALSSSQMQIRSLSSTQVLLRRNKGKQVQDAHPTKVLKYRSGPRWLIDPVVPTSPLQKTHHPKDRFQDEETAVDREVSDANAADRPLALALDAAEEDPYACEPRTCLLCPRRFAEGKEIRPSWKNPKLLAQFVSQHSGMVYDKHITGLCNFMQGEVEREVAKAQNAGYLATKMKEVQYMRDPALFNPAKPARRNPY